MVEDIGESCAAKSKGLVDLSKCSVSHSERDMDVVTRKFNLRLPVPITHLDKIPGMRYTGSFDAISLQDWCKFLINYNVWHVMCGLRKADRNRECMILSEFWKRYKVANPNSGLWAEFQQYNVDVSRCCPLVLHGDEGRGRKKAPFLITAYHSVIGFGTAAANASRTHRAYLRMRLNYSENSNIHRMLTCVLPKMNKDDLALKAILNFITHDSLHVLRHGVESEDGDRYFMAVLNVTGDWAWLAKCGNLARSYSNVEKRPRGVSSVPRGVCHWCKAGQLNVPFEDFRRRPLWKNTCFEAGDNPFTSVPTLLQLPHDPNRPASFFIYDFWHSFHLGLGKTWLASVLALISDRMGSSNIEGRFAELTDLYLQWCDEQHETPYLTAISKETIGWIDRQKYPNGFWSKGHITVALLRFVGHWLRTHSNEIADCPMLSQCGLATEQINEAISSMYRQDVWMKRDVANDIGNKGLSFVETYGRLARYAFDNSKALWALMPKGHVVHHLFSDLFEAADEWVINPLVFAVQISEDFVGKKSRLARRVHATQVIRRVLERSLVSSHQHWTDAGFFQG